MKSQQKNAMSQSHQLGSGLKRDTEYINEYRPNADPFSMAPTPIVPMPIKKFAAVSFTNSLPGLCSKMRKNSKKNAANNTAVPITFVLCMVAVSYTHLTLPTSDLV